jgi:hypothetical protein
MVLQSEIPEQSCQEENVSRYDNSSICELQRNDKDISAIRKWLENQKQPQAKDLNSGGVMIKSLWAQRDMLVIQKDILFR